MHPFNALQSVVAGGEKSAIRSLRVTLEQFFAQGSLLRKTIMFDSIEELESESDAYIAWYSTERFS